MVPFIIVKIVLIATVVAAITVGVIVGIIYGTVVENVSSCKSLQMPQFLEIVHFKNAIIPVWSSPDNSEGCEISYKVEYNDNEGTVQTIVTSGFSYAFETNPSACITITLSVTIVIDSESIGDPLVKNYEVGMGTVTNLDTSLINDVLQITWDRPLNSNKCQDMIYTVNYKGNSVSISNTTHNIAIADMFKCENAVITVTPMSAGLHGIDDSVNFETGIGSVSDITANENGNTVNISWTPPQNTESCGDLVYDISDGSNPSFNSTDPNFEFPIENLQKCDITWFTITPKAERFDGLEAKSGPVKIEIGSVSDITANENGNTVNISWTPPQNTESCGDLVYDISDGSNPSFNSTDPNFEFPIENLQKCDITWFTITPKAERFDGLEAKSGPVKIEIGSVSDITANENGNTVNISWTPPQNTESCGDLVYDISDGSNPSFNSTDPNFDFPIENLQKCDITWFTITPKAERFDGSEAKSGPVKIEIGSVSDITANENGNTVNISWTPPQNTESCGDLVYDISDGSNPSFNSTDPNFEFPIENLQKCDITWFTITPKAERFDGLEAKSGPVKIEIGSVSGITANENGNTVKIIWTPPQNIESCDDITYDISSGNFKNETKDNFIDVTFNDLNGCENITFTIIPQSQNEYRGISSDSEIYNFEGCEDHGGFT